MKHTNHFMGRLISCILLVVLGLVIGYTVAIKINTLPENLKPPSADKEILYWYDPMMPDQHFDKPGKSPYMDMELMPKYADTATPSDGIRIDPRVVQNIGVKLGAVEKSQVPDMMVYDKATNGNGTDTFALQKKINDTAEKIASKPINMHDGLVVPSEALINTGRHTFVIVSEQDGYFKPVEVVLGKEQNGKTEIISGLSEGEKIVISGQFLIDSEANFSSAINRLSNAGEMP